MKLDATHTAKSLGDIAEHFGEKAADLRAQIEEVRTQSRKDELSFQASTWEQAADILRKTRIVP